jgi:inorganic pyrophosphatase
MIDGGEADDKIIAVLANDNFWGEISDISELPVVLVERLRHYFSTYKIGSGKDMDIYIERDYGVVHALDVVNAAIEDYQEEYAEGV